MSTYSNRLQPALQNLLYTCSVLPPEIVMHDDANNISADVQRITLNASCMTIPGGRTKQLDIFCRVTGFTSDFLSFIKLWNLFGSFTEPFNFSLHGVYKADILAEIHKYHFYQLCDQYLDYCSIYTDGSKVAIE